MIAEMLNMNIPKIHVIQNPVDEVDESLFIRTFFAVYLSKEGGLDSLQFITLSSFKICSQSTMLFLLYLQTIVTHGKTSRR